MTMPSLLGMRKVRKNINGSEKPNHYVVGSKFFDLETLFFAEHSLTSLGNGWYIAHT